MMHLGWYGKKYQYRGTTKNKMIMMHSNEKKGTLVYTSEQKKRKKSKEQKQPYVRKKRDLIHDEILGEFSRYGMRVRWRMM